MSETTTCGECGGAGYIDNRDLCLGCAGSGVKVSKPRQPSEADQLRAELARLSALVPRWRDGREAPSEPGWYVTPSIHPGDVLMIHYGGVPRQWREAVISWYLPAKELAASIPPLPGTETP